MSRTVLRGPVKAGYCCLCGTRPLPRTLTTEQATRVLLAWTKQDIHPSDYAAKWVAAIEEAERINA